MELVSFFSFYTLLILFLHLRANNKSSICIVSQQSLFLKSKKKKINKEIEEIKIQKKKGTVKMMMLEMIASGSVNQDLSNVFPRRLSL